MTRRHYFCRRAPKKPTAKAITQDKSHAALGAIAYVTFALLLLFVLFQFVGCGLGSPGSEEETPGNSENQISGMEIGDVQILNFAGGLANLEFLDGNSNQRYVLALTGGLGGMDLNLQPGTSGGNPPSAPQASGDSESADDDDQDENPAISSNPATAQPPHDWFRKQEIQMLQTGKIGGAIGFHPNNDFLGLGTPENFNVLTDVNTNFSTISTTRVGMGSLVNIYLDNSTTATLTPEQLLDLTETLDNLSALLMNLLGPSSDINGNGKVDIVLSPMLETFGNNNPLSGYFWAGDLTPSNQQAASNEREVIFLVAPDSSSFYGGTVPVAEVLTRILPGVYAHEFQHLLNFLNKETPEDPTINEALSHAIENHIGYPHELRFKQEDCLNNIDSVTLGSSQTDLATRGCAGLLIQHLCEQNKNPASCLANIIQSPLPGWQNVAFTGGDDLGKLIAKFLGGLVVTGNTLNSNSPYRFEPLDQGPAGDITGFDPYGAYNDYRETLLGGVTVDSGGIQLPYSTNVFGFAHFVEISTANSNLSIQISGYQLDGLFAQGAGGALIRIPDEGFSTVKAKSAGE